MHLVQGRPGTGKTTLGLQFLLEGLRQGEPVLYLTLSQTRLGLEKIARSHGWSLEDVHVHELSSVSEKGAEEQVLFHTADVELQETMAAFFEVVRQVGPARVVFDSMAEIRLLAGSTLNYRREIIALRRFFSDRFCTVIMLDDKTVEGGDIDLVGMVHGVIDLEQEVPVYGETRRRLSIVKMRGIPYIGGYHHFRIRTGGVEVYPWLTPARMAKKTGRSIVKSDIEGLDALLGGGFMEGTACLLMGPSGTGKTSVALRYAHAAAERGQHAAIFLFDEQRETFLARAKGIGMDIEPFMREGRLEVCQINTGELSPSEFAQRVRKSVEDNQAEVVVLDSLTGYVNAMLRERLLISQVHELLAYLSREGVLSLVVVAQQGQLGDGAGDPVNVSYMADSLLLFRHFEHEGTLRQAVYVAKKRHGPHERTAREIRLTGEGIEVGPPLSKESDTSFNFGLQQPREEGYMRLKEE